MTQPGGTPASYDRKTATHTTPTTVTNNNRVVTAPSRRSLVRGRRCTSASAFDVGADAVNSISADNTRRGVVQLRSAPSSFLLACCCFLPAAVQGFVPPCSGGVGGGGGAFASSLLRQHPHHQHQHQHRRQYQQRQQQQQQGLSAATLFRTAGRVSLLPVGGSSSGSVSGGLSGSVSGSHNGSHNASRGVSMSGSCSDSILGGDGRLPDQGSSSSSSRSPPSLSALNRLRRAIGRRPPPPSSLAATSTATTATDALNEHITTAAAAATTTTVTPSIGDGYGKDSEGSLLALPALAVGVAGRHISSARRAALRAARGAAEAARSAATPIRRRRAAGVALVSAAAFCFLRPPALAAAAGGLAAHGGRSLVGMIPAAPAAAGGVVQGGAEITLRSVAPKLALWFTLFVTSAAFHSAEIAITTLYPWKVKEFAEEEGENSPFQVLNTDITRVLTTILVATTVCTIYNAALFTNLAIQMFGSAGLAYATAALTVTTLFFGELLPKAMGVNNAEVVARRILPVIIVLSVVLNPVAKSFTLISKLMLSMLGFKSTETGRVSEEELRLIVTGAKMSGGIESQEGMMIEGVLDLQDTKISEIMRPRVEVVAIEANSTMMDLYTLHQETKYSRIPVYSGEIDRISGVVLSKDLLDFVQEPEKLSSVLVADETESTYFVPETMSVWNVLEEMRRRRLHMAIVVDEYGGTAGVVTLEDILEEVVGEIYDEKEDEEFREEEHYINVNEDGSFTIHGMADLEDVCTSLAFQQVNEDDLKEFGTLSGYLCSQAGEIPAAGDYVMVGGYMFTVTKADERRIEEVHARLIGAGDAIEGGEGAGKAGDQGRNGGGNTQDDGGGGGQANADHSAPASSTSGNPNQ